MATSGYVVVLTTLAPDHDASRFARTLVEERLAACVNVLPEMRSIYRWKGAVEEEGERQIIIKTQAAIVDVLKRRIAQLHSYDVPEVIVLSIADGADAYLRWITESTTTSST